MEIKEDSFLSNPVKKLSDNEFHNLTVVKFIFCALEIRNHNHSIWMRNCLKENITQDGEDLNQSQPPPFKSLGSSGGFEMNRT